MDLDAGTSAEESYHEGERSSPSLPPVGRRTMKKRNSNDDEEDFLVEEVTSKKKIVVLAKEYGTTTG